MKDYNARNYYEDLREREVESREEEMKVGRWEYINGESEFVTVSVEGWRKTVSGHTSLVFDARAEEEMDVYVGADNRKLLMTGTVGDLCYPSGR